MLITPFNQRSEIASTLADPELDSAGVALAVELILPVDAQHESLAPGVGAGLVRYCLALWLPLLLTDLESSYGLFPVPIGELWDLIDCTWDADYVDPRTKRFGARYETSYLFADPRAFLHTHFPGDPRWQPIKSPVSYKEGEELRFQIAFPAARCYHLELSVGEAKPGIFTRSYIGPGSLPSRPPAERPGCSRGLPAPPHSPPSRRGDAPAVPGVSGCAPRCDPRAPGDGDQGERVIVRAVFPEPGDYVLRINVNRKLNPLHEGWSIQSLLYGPLARGADGRFRGTVRAEGSELALVTKQGDRYVALARYEVRWGEVR